MAADEVTIVAAPSTRRFPGQSLSPKKARDIYTQLHQGATEGRLADAYGVTELQIRLIGKGELFANATAELRGEVPKPRRTPGPLSVPSLRKLTPAQVLEIARRVASPANPKGEVMADLAREFGVTPGVIRDIRDRKTYRDVLGEATALAIPAPAPLVPSAPRAMPRPAQEQPEHVQIRSLSLPSATHELADLSSLLLSFAGRGASLPPWIDGARASEAIERARDLADHGR